MVASATGGQFSCVAVWDYGKRHVGPYPPLKIELAMVDVSHIQIDEVHSAKPRSTLLVKLVPSSSPPPPPTLLNASTTRPILNAPNTRAIDYEGHTTEQQHRQLNNKNNETDGDKRGRPLHFVRTKKKKLGVRLGLGHG